MTSESHGLEDQPLLGNHPVAMRASLILWVVGGLLYIALAVPAIADVVQVFDDAVFDLAVKLQNDFFVSIADLLDILGSIIVTAPIMVGIAVYLAWKKRWQGFWFWLLAMAASQLLIGPIKSLYERPRPPIPLVETTGYSFPSGHATAGAAIAVALVIVLIPTGPKRRYYEVLAAFFAVTMAMSRVYLRAHWFTDVLAGAALGAAVAIAAASLVHLIDERRTARKV
jgi:membrane-associated phospholipid phosphatase